MLKLYFLSRVQTIKISDKVMANKKRVSALFSGFRAKKLPCSE